MTYTLPSAVDPEGVTVIITESSSAAFITISGSDIIMSPSASLNSNVGTFIVTLTLSDGLNLVSVSFNVVVSNLPPYFSPSPVT